MVSGGELADVVRKRYGDIDYEWGIASASTDFVSRNKMTCQWSNTLIYLNDFHREISLTVCTSLSSMRYY